MPLFTTTTQICSHSLQNRLPPRFSARLRFRESERRSSFLDPPLPRFLFDAKVEALLPRLDFDVVALASDNRENPEAESRRGAAALLQVGLHLRTRHLLRRRFGSGIVWKLWRRRSLIGRSVCPIANQKAFIFWTSIFDGAFYVEGALRARSTLSKVALSAYLYPLF